ncbi:unnamed protein product [Effrenium voratum]|uniref:Methyltransferase FkbM domain-containing protein n=1 Tax=Effrenium voratum TaxID=2562239 RepID=A0AA36HSX1_9DINO|nr:unnamed protein product [Effrenium voratum]
MARRLGFLLILGAEASCWSGDFSFASCCLVSSAQCWDGAFTYERCCLQRPLLSEPEAASIRKMKQEALDCGCSKPDLGPPTFGGAFTWCKFHQAIMLNQDLRPYYLPFLQMSTEALAQCPLGVLQMALLDATLKVSNSQVMPELTQTPSFLRAEEALELMLESGVSLVDVATSGWMVFNQMSALRAAAQRRGATFAFESGCLTVPPGRARMLQTLTEGVNFMPLGVASLMRVLLDDTSGAEPCQLPSAGMFLLMAYSTLQQTVLPEEKEPRLPGVAPRPGEEAAMLLGAGEARLRAALLAEAKAAAPHSGPLALLLATPWPVAEVLDLLSYPGRVPVTVSGALEELLNLQKDHPLLELALSNASPVPTSYAFRVNPYREMVSDMVRYTRLPFCGLRPFLRMVADVAKNAVAAGCGGTGATAREVAPEECQFTFVEGGPHLGDCALWAATALRLVGVQTRAIAFEPLPDAAALFQQSVSENGLSAYVAVRNAALGETSGAFTELIHFRGHNGQATVNGQDFPSQDRREVVTVPALELALDEQIPAAWPRIDALKLSVNGAERNTLAGARRLLSKRRICSVLMHATKCKRGRRSPAEDPAPEPGVSKFAFELMQFLHEGDMDVYEHNDATEGPGRGRVRRLGGAKDMDAIFDDPALTEQVYFLALSKDQRCGRARRHFHVAAGRPAEAPLEDAGQP